MVSASNVTGLILAGGAGRRVGHRDKGLILWQGKPLIAHVSDCLKPQVGEMLISCNRNVARYAKYTAQTVADLRANHQGPLAGLEAAAPHIRTQLLVVVGCDMPDLPANFVARLLAPLALGDDDAPEICFAHDGTRAQFLCAAMRTKCLTSLPGFLDEGHRAVRDWYACRRSIAVDFSDERDKFRNYNQLA
jgi:molybdopterin-guanine dinucleotide biosynthesis protein A